jgi:fructose-bisphosphate aldolase class 1
MSSTTLDRTLTPSSRTEQEFGTASTDAVINEYQQRWNLASEMVETLFEKASQSINKGGYPIVPQTVVGIVANIFGFTPRAGLVESELHTKAEALNGNDEYSKGR